MIEQGCTDARRLVIGIDPGPQEHGVVVFDGKRVVDAQNLHWREAGPYVVRAVLEDGASVACEMIECFGMPVGRSVFETVLRIGQLFNDFQGVRLIPRRDVKMHLCGNVRAKDPNVRQALLDKVGECGTKKHPGPCYGISGHLWSALGVAVTAFDLPETKNEWRIL